MLRSLLALLVVAAALLGCDPPPAFAASFSPNPPANAVYYTPQGTGASARSVGALLGELGGNIKNWGAKCDGSTDDSAAFTNAFAAHDRVYVPWGVTCAIASTVTIPNGRTLAGVHRDTSKVRYTGTGSAFVNNGGGAPNLSGSGSVTIDELYIEGTGASSSGAALEFKSRGYAYNQVKRVHITGVFKFGVIFDGSEVSSISDSIIENGAGVDNHANIWITNGDDNSASQTTGFSNVITVERTQLGSQSSHTIDEPPVITGYNVVDDGGDTHVFRSVNFNGAALPMRVASVTNLEVSNSDFENHGVIHGSANILFADTTLYGGDSGAGHGPVKGFTLRNNTFAADMVSSSSCNLRFTASSGSVYQENGTISNNKHRNNLGRACAIDVTQLRWSKVEHETDETDSLTFFSGAHHDANGNALTPPPNSADAKRTTLGRTDSPLDLRGGLEVKGQKWQSFVVEIANVSGTLKHAILASTGNGVASAFADKITGASSTQATTPAVGSSTDFTSGLGINSNAIVLNTTDQTPADQFLFATISNYDGNVSRPRVYWGTNFSRDVNGTTRKRLELYLIDDMTGAAWPINTTNIPSGKSLHVHVLGFVS